MVRKLIGKVFLGVQGWTLYGEKPPHNKYVLTAAPHTSNWDFPFLVAASWVFGVKLHWLGKHTLFKGPMGWVYRQLGGIPVDRTARQNLVDQLVLAFEKTDVLHLTIPPSGTRSYRDYWKSGFYHVARKAGVPVVCGLLDYKTKRVGFGPLLWLTGDVGADMDVIRAFYFGVEGKWPENQARIRLRAEDDAADER